MDLFGLDAALRREELQPVAVERQMARRDHDRAVHLRRLEHRRHEHRRRRGEPAVHRHAARRRQRLEDRLLQHRRRDARIMADRDAKIPLAQPRALREELHEPACDAVRRLRREIHRLVRHPFDGDPAHVAAVRELQQSFFCHHNNAPCHFSLSLDMYSIGSGKFPLFPAKISATAICRGTSSNSLNDGRRWGPGRSDWARVFLARKTTPKEPRY